MSFSSERAALVERRARGVILRMRGQGLTLSQTHARPKDLWRLSDGTSGASDVVKRVLSDPQVIGCADGLFPGTPQSWRRVASSLKGDVGNA